MRYPTVGAALFALAMAAVGFLILGVGCGDDKPPAPAVVCVAPPAGGDAGTICTSVEIWLSDVGDCLAEDGDYRIGEWPPGGGVLWPLCDFCRHEAAK